MRTLYTFTIHECYGIGELWMSGKPEGVEAHSLDHVQPTSAEADARSLHLNHA